MVFQPSKKRPDCDIQIPIDYLTYCLNVGDNFYE